MLRQLTTLLIHELLSDDSPSLKSRARAFLLSLRQRHPSAFEGAVQNVIEDDEALKDDIERLIVELSVVSFHSSTSNGYRAHYCIFSMGNGRVPQVHWPEAKKTWILSSHRMMPMLMSAPLQYAICFQLWRRVASTPTSLCVDFHKSHLGSKRADLTNLHFLVLNSLCSSVSHDRHRHTSRQYPLLPAHSHHTHHLLSL